MENKKEISERDAIGKEMDEGFKEIFVYIKGKAMEDMPTKSKDQAMQVQEKLNLWNYIGKEKDIAQHYFAETNPETQHSRQQLWPEKIVEMKKKVSLDEYDRLLKKNLTPELYSKLIEIRKKVGYADKLK